MGVRVEGPYGVLHRPTEELLRDPEVRRVIDAAAGMQRQEGVDLLINRSSQGGTSKLLRLLRNPWTYRLPWNHMKIRERAADEIERLRDELMAARAVIKVLSDRHDDADDVPPDALEKIIEHNRALLREDGGTHDR